RLVADADDDRDAHGGDGTRDDLLVERPETLERAAAARQDQHVAFTAPVRELERARDLLRRAVPLDARRIDQHRNRRKAAPQRRQHVADRRARRRRDDADAFRYARQRALAFGIEQSLRLQAPLQRLETATQQAFARFLDLVDDELELAARLVE